MDDILSEKMKSKNMIKKIRTIIAVFASALMLLGAGRQTSKQESCSHESWKRGVCADCGAEPGFYDELPDKYFAPCVHSGELVEIKYETPFYYSSNRKPVNQRTAQVYIPYGYDPETKYDVMILMPGNIWERHVWLNYADNKDHPGIKGRDIIDNLHYYGDIAPTIFVAIGSWDGGYVDRWAFQLASEIKYVLLPMICAKYSTYAEEATPEGIEAARDHFGVGGCSNGGVYAYDIGLNYDKELFGNVMVLSPKLLPIDALKEVSRGDNTYEVHMLYIGAGNREGNTKESKAEYDQLLEACPWLEEGRNTFYNTVTGVHNWQTWRTQLVNAMKVLF